MGGGLSKDMISKAKILEEWLEEQTQKTHNPAKKLQLHNALELTRKLLANPTELRLIPPLDELLEELGQPGLGSARVYFQSQVLFSRSAPSTLEKLSHMKFSGPRDQCPKCGEDKESCKCNNK